MATEWNIWQVWPQETLTYLHAFVAVTNLSCENGNVSWRKIISLIKSLVDEQVFPNWVLTLAVRLLGGKGKGTGKRNADMAKVTLL